LHRTGIGPAQAWFVQDAQGFRDGFFPPGGHAADQARQKPTTASVETSGVRMARAFWSSELPPASFSNVCF